MSSLTGRQKCLIFTAIGFFAVGVILVVLGMVFVLAIFPSIVKSGVNSGKVLGLNDDGTLNDFTNTWKNPLYVSTMQYWAYDYKNTIGIMNRAIYPDMDEKGPYAYTEVFDNEDISFSVDKMHMDFSRNIKYYYDPSQSCAGCDPYVDKVTVPDIVFVVGLNALFDTVDKVLRNEKVAHICGMITKSNATCEKLRGLIEGEIGLVLDSFETGPFVTVTVDQLLFSGYDSPMIENLFNGVVNMINGFFNKTIIPEKYVNLHVPVALQSDNGTTDTIFTVNTGYANPDLSGFTESFTNKSNASLPSEGSQLPSSWWPADKPGCSMDAINHARLIYGTNGDYFQSFLKRDQPLPIFDTSICRTVNLAYEKDVETAGFSGYRFILPPSEFDFSLKDNCGFCTQLQHGFYDEHQGDWCFPSGIMDISGCQGGVPLALSKPHFYQADDIAQRFVPRFKPRYDNDETIIDVEPITGTVLMAQEKLQINLLLNQFPSINAYKVMRPGAYPLIWVNESYYIDQNTINQLNSQLFTPQKIINIICWTAVGVGGLLMVLAILFVFIAFCCIGDEKFKFN